MSDKLKIIDRILNTETKKAAPVPYIDKFKARLTYLYVAFTFFLVGSLVFVEIPPQNKDTLITLTGILIGSGLMMILGHWFKRVVDQLKEAGHEELQAYRKEIDDEIDNRKEHHDGN